MTLKCNSDDASVRTCGQDGGLSVEDLDRAALAVETRIQEQPLAFSADFENGSLGVTRNGFAQPMLTVTDNASAKDLVVLIGREDADETTGSWGIEGMVRALLSPSLQDLRRRYIFKIVPMVGIDGVVAGAHHSAGYGYGGVRLG